MKNDSIPFVIKRINESLWSVNFDGKDITIQTKKEAESLAQLPVELMKIHDDTPGEPDPILVKGIIDICESHHINCFAVRQLDAWYKNHLQR